jgi:hypothetical protein
MAAPRELRLETPGEAPAPEAAAAPAALPDAAALLSALSPDERAALLSAAAASIASAAQRAGVALPPPGDEQYPDEADIDPATVPFGTAMRSKQGWVVSTAPDPRNLLK